MELFDTSTESAVVWDRVVTLLAADRTRGDAFG